MMRTSMSSLASLKPVPVRGKKKENVFAQRPLHLFPVVILASGNRQGTRLQSEQPSPDNWL